MILLYLIPLFLCAFSLLKKKEIDFYFIYFLSSVIFYYTIFFGFVFHGRLSGIIDYKTTIDPITYIVLSINLFITFIYLRKGNKDHYRIKIPQKGEKFIMKIFIIIVFILSIWLGKKYGIFSFRDFDKGDLEDETSVLGAYFKYMALFNFIYIIVSERIHYSFIWKFLGVFPALTTYLYGNRSYIVIGIIAISFDFMYRQCRQQNYTIVQYFAKHKIYVISALLFVAFTFIIKGIYYALFAGDYDLVTYRLTSIEFYQQVAMVSEPNTIMMNLNTIIANNYYVFPSTYLSLWAFFIPFMTDAINDLMGIPKFTFIFQHDLYASEGVTNRASTFIGETYANGNVFMLVIVVTLFLTLLGYFFKKYKNCESNITKTTFLLAGIDASFYIQRNSMYFEFSRLRFYFYIFVLLYLLMILYRNYVSYK